MLRKVYVLVALLASQGVYAQVAPGANGAGDGGGKKGEHKITICHRTNAITNPYVVITVDKNAADGLVGNDRNHKSDHFGNPSHQGPVFNADVHTKSGMDWGDIIPPMVDDVGNQVHNGRNWSEEGMAIYNNGCNVVKPRRKEEESSVPPGCLPPSDDGKCACAQPGSGFVANDEADEGEGEGDAARRLLQSGKGKGVGSRKITICHRTRAVKNPYVQITVDENAADGNLGNDNGRGDHFGNDEHAGPVFDAGIHTKSSNVWGDIIPPIPNVHAGKNWNEAGRAIYNNGCNFERAGIPARTAAVKCWRCDCSEVVPAVPSADGSGAISQPVDGTLVSSDLPAAPPGAAGSAGGPVGVGGTTPVGGAEGSAAGTGATTGTTGQAGGAANGFLPESVISGSGASTAPSGASPALPIALTVVGLALAGTSAAVAMKKAQMSKMQDPLFDGTEPSAIEAGEYPHEFSELDGFDGSGAMPNQAQPFATSSPNAPNGGGGDDMFSGGAAEPNQAQPFAASSPTGGDGMDDDGFQGNGTEPASVAPFAASSPVTGVSGGSGGGPGIGNAEYGIGGGGGGADRHGTIDYGMGAGGGGGDGNPELKINSHNVSARPTRDAGVYDMFSGQTQTPSIPQRTAHFQG